MINPGNGSRWGIKPSGSNVTADIHDLIDKANYFVVVCGYNFSSYNHPTSIIPRLIARRNAGVAVLLIMPPRMWGFGNTNHTANIQQLINNGVGVILNSDNHSKWIITDYGYYYGSLNFTKASMTRKVEVISICNTLLQPSAPRWMKQTKQEFLQFAVSELSHFNTVTATTNLGTVNTLALTTLRHLSKRILRYNPEIEKVRTTLLNYEDVRIDLSSMIDSYFPLISLTELDRIWQLINSAIYSLDGLADRGNDMLIKFENQTSKTKDIAIYNRIHSILTRQVENIIETIESGEFQNNVQERVISANKKIESILKEYLE